MKRLLAVVATLLVASSVFAGTANAEGKTLAFVSNHAELYAALEAAERGTIGSVAISEKYYQEGTSRVQKNQLRGLIARTFELGNRAVYIYGQPLDISLANELLGGDRNCSPVFAVGRTSGGRVVCMFAGTMSEDEMRNNLRIYDKQ